MNIIKWSVAGLIGGLVGAAAWAGFVYFTSYEIGWLASLVGVLAGLGVRFAAGPQIGYLPGWVAVGVAVFCVVVGKYAVVELVVQKLFQPTALTDERLTVFTASRIMDDKFDEGHPVPWPNGVDPEEADKQADFPPEVWAEAEVEVRSLTRERRLELQRTYDESIADSRSQATNRVFLASFSGFDLLWIGLAALAAWRLGTGLNRAA